MILLVQLLVMTGTCIHSLHTSTCTRSHFHTLTSSTFSSHCLLTAISTTDSVDSHLNRRECLSAEDYCHRQPSVSHPNLTSTSSAPTRQQHQPATTTTHTIPLHMARERRHRGDSEGEGKHTYTLSHDIHLSRATCKAIDNDGITDDASPGPLRHDDQDQDQDQGSKTRQVQVKGRTRQR